MRKSKVKNQKSKIWIVLFFLVGLYFFVSLSRAQAQVEGFQLIPPCGDTFYQLKDKDPKPARTTGEDDSCPASVALGAYTNAHKKYCDIAGFTTQECTFCHFLQVFINVAKLIFMFMGGVAAILFIVGGILFIINFGNTEKIQRAKSLVVNTVIGVTVILLAWTIVNVGIALLTSPTGQSMTVGTIFGSRWNQPLNCPSLE